MKKSIFTLIALLLAAGSVWAAPKITITQGNAKALYRCGEPAEFSISVEDDGKPSASGSLSVKAEIYGGPVVFTETFDLAAGNPVTVSAALDEPGFLLVTASLKGAFDVLAGAGFEPEKIQLGHDLPEDFRQFWEDGRQQLAGDTVHLEKLDKYSNEKVTSYIVTVDVLNGGKLYGFLAVPNGDGPFPALVTVPGAGPGAVAPAVSLAERGVIALTMNVHQYQVPTGDSAKTKELYAEQKEKFYYPHLNSNDRDLYFFRNVILGVDRAITHVARMPQWDQRHFVVEGSSQGGGMALIMAGFNRNITAAAANVPALCDHGARKLNRHPGWPKLTEKAKAVSAYYDAGNFARFITCPVLVSAGFIDQTCSPSSVYAVYNLIQAPKTMIDLPTVGHAIPAEYTKVKTPWVDHQLGLRKNPPAIKK